MPERLFLALWPDPSVREALAALAAGVARGRAGRATHPEDLHLTLVFLGGLEETKRRCAEEVAASMREEGFTLRLDHLGFWPRRGIQWCAPSVIPASLSRLVAGLHEGLRHCDIELESRPYRPHVTLVRKAMPVGGEQRPESTIEPIDWSVAELVLASGSGGGPPRYRVLRRWPLMCDGIEVVVG